jgi:hypothetical protein
MATLNLPTSSRTAVWRVIRARILADPVLPVVCKVMQFFANEREAAADITQFPSPSLRFYAMPGPATWFDESTMEGELVVTVEAWITGLDEEDVLDLQNAIEAALWPPAVVDQYAFQAQLVAAGAKTGYIVGSDPLAVDPSEAGQRNGWHPMGRFTIDVLRLLIPTNAGALAAAETEEAIGHVRIGIRDDG